MLGGKSRRCGSDASAQLVKRFGKREEAREKEEQDKDIGMVAQKLYTAH